MLRLPLAPRAMAFAALALLTGCVTTSAPPPIVSLDGRVCAAKPDLAAAQALPLEVEDAKGVAVTFDAATPCLRPPGASKFVYALFRLPDAPDGYIVSVTSAPVGRALVAPYLQLLDADGKVLREMSRESFLFHGASLYLGLRAHAGERYLLVASDAQAAGESVSQLVGSTQSSMMSTGTVFFSVHTGSEMTNTYTYAYNGTVTVSARPVPKAN